jgi:hypothetical protein
LLKSLTKKNDLALFLPCVSLFRKKAPTISKKTLSEYTGSVNFIETAVIKLGMQA